MAGSWTRGGVALLFLVGAGCQREATNSPDPCANGACEQTEQCEFGSCDFEFDPDDTTITEHSSNAGTFAEGTSATCPFEESELPPMEALLDDTEVPEFNRGRSRGTNYKRGRAFLQDHEIHEHMLGYQGHLFDCLDKAACYSEDVLGGSGELDFRFELEPSGKVTAVSVKTSEELDEPFVLSCARRSLYEYEFPPYQGARMVVSYSLEISTTDG